MRLKNIPTFGHALKRIGGGEGGETVKNVIGAYRGRLKALRRLILRSLGESLAALEQWK